MLTDEGVLQCILNINIRVQNIQVLKLELTKLNIPLDSPIADDVVTGSYVKICSVLDELEILNHYCKDDLHLRNVLYCLKPLIDHVSQYENGFRQMRNGLVAHLNRNRLDQYEPFWHRTTGLDVPQSHEELIFVWNCLDKIRVVLISYFPTFQDYHAYTHGIFLRYFEQKKEEFFSWKVISDEEIRAIVNEKMIEKGLLTPGANYWDLLMKQNSEVIET